LNPVRTILRRELASYFATPLAYVFVTIFLFFQNLLTFYVGRILEIEQADLRPFFLLLPWLFLILIPAVSMRFWPEERASGSIELLLTQPITMWQAVLGKFLAGWLFIAFALVLTTPLWITINWLGSPDNGVIVAAYIGSLFMAGAYLAVGSFMSALTRSQVIAFILAFVLCFLLVMAGFPMVLDVARSWAWPWITEGIAALSFYTHFENITKGVLDLRDVLYFALVIVFFLAASAAALESRKSR
jgi:ABC-2 type transport system permease protein